MLTTVPCLARVQVGPTENEDPRTHQGSGAFACPDALTASGVAALRCSGMEPVRREVDHIEYVVDFEDDDGETVRG
jgi:hypothetical protein